VGARLGRSFYRRSALEVAPDLLGRVLVRRTPSGRRVAARIVEVEAYQPDDEASHAFRGPTQRNRSMFGPPGHLYVYLSYGMHCCMNVVTEAAGIGMAVLLRAAEPLEGLDEMRRRRRGAVDRDLLRGPGRWARAFGVDRRHDGADLVRGGDLWLEPGKPATSIATGPRVGISVATDLPWRFAIAGSPWASRPAPRAP
jgi:DNA-3-methyladenine glycosylase